MVKFLLDEPISNLHQDCLGRERFARELAALLVRNPDSKPFVVALYGDWGSGKTSLRNMVLDVVREKGAHAPEVLLFSPWQWEEQKEITEAFFSELEKLLPSKSLGPRRTRAIAAIKKFTANLGIMTQALTGIDKLARAILVLATVIGVGAFFTSPTAKLVISVASGLALFYRDLMEWIKSFFESISNRLELGREKTLTERRNLVDQLMGALEKRILIIIDDIDRLEVKQIREIFQLVKANANFPNITYLLLFQRDTVEKSLFDDAHNGREFLDKIIQYGIDIPLIERQRLESILKEHLGKCLQHDIEDDTLDQARWLTIFNIFRFQFQSLRDVYRYVSTLSFHLELFKEKEIFEINIIDLIALESLRLFQPDVYRKIKTYRVIITGVADSADSSDQDAKRNEVSEALEDMVSTLVDEEKHHVRQLLGELFPILAWSTTSLSFRPTTESKKEWLASLRICHPELFDKYFILALPTNEIPQWRIEWFIKNSGDRDALVREFRNSISEGSVQSILDKINLVQQKIPLEHILDMSAALFDIGDDLPNTYPAGFNVGTPPYAQQLIASMLRRFDLPEKRMEVLSQAIKSSEGVLLPCRLVVFEADFKRRNSDPNSMLINEKNLESLKSVCVHKIKLAGEGGKLLSQPHLINILYAWRVLGGPQDASDWVHNVINCSPHAALMFLRALLVRSVRQSGASPAEVKWLIRKTSIEDFVPVVEIENKMDEMQKICGSDLDRIAIAAFKETLERRGRGSSDDDPWD